ncbi:MAG TPA: hypothetical protein VFV49_08630 [Thermoanaerobaculia bacterium]|nr:hypothetical protein [Thermoanaerobaculia bacterium]
MSDEIRDVTTITFSGPRFDDAGLELDVLSELLAYRKLLIETAKELWRTENRERQRLPKGFEESIRLKFYSIEPGSAVVPIKRVVLHDDSLLFEPPPRVDEIDEAAQLIDETITAVSEDRVIPDRMPKAVLPLLAALGENLREGEAMKTRAVRSSRAAEFTCETRTRVERLLEAVYEDRVEIVGEVRSADVDQRNFAIRDSTGAKVPSKFRPEHEAEITDALHDHASCRVAILGVGEFSTRDGSLRRILRVDVLERRPAVADDEYDDSAPPLWQSVVDLGASLPVEEWDRVPTDLAANLDHYLYGRSGEDE